MKKINYTLLLLLILLVSGCIKNDIPFPVVPGNITTFEVAGQLEPATIDYLERTVVVQMADTANLKNVKVVSFKTSDETAISPAVTPFIDLSAPKTYLLTTYQEYTWTVTAVQHIVRNVLVENQVGEAVIDVEKKTAVVYVPTFQPLDAVTVLEMNLGPSNATTLPVPTSVKDFSGPVDFTVSCRDVVEHWKVSVQHTESLVATKEAEPWAKFAIVHGTKPITTTENPTFQYKKTGDSQWMTCPQTNVTVAEVAFEAKLTGLAPASEYLYRAVLGTSIGQQLSFTTEAASVIPNLSMDEWNTTGTPPKNAWNPWPQGGEAYWMTGNGGVTITGSSNTTPVEGAEAYKGKAAKLETVVAGAFGIVKLAAGNLFTGTFKLNLGNLPASAIFGRPYTGRPVKVTGYYRYYPKVIDKQDKGTDMLGQMDKCHIYAYLENWGGSETRPDNRITVATAEFETDQLVPTYTKIELPLVYKTTSVMPTHIVMVATSSKMGADFTGGVGSILYVDEFEFVFE